MTGLYPIYYAARRGHLEICKWLFHHGGAHDDIRKKSRNGYSPLRVALITLYWSEEVVQWLILNGALSPDDDGVIDATLMRNELHPRLIGRWVDDRRLPILSRAQNALTTHDTIQLFLKGTIIPSSSFRRHPNNQCAKRSKRPKVSPSSSSPLVMFKGKSGILELISKYVENPKPQELRICRQLIRLLPTFIEDVPFVEEEEEGDEDE